VGASETDLQLIMTGVKPNSTENVTVADQPMKVQHYDTADYYFAGDRLAMIVTTNPAVENPLGNALEAYKKAAQLDVKGKKTKDIAEAIGTIHDKFSGEAVNAYTLKDFALSSKLFEEAFNASLVEPFAQTDTNSIYNAGLTAWIANDVARAKVFFDKCLEYKYSGEDGDVYSRLSTLAEKEGNKELALKYLEDGFMLYPKSQSILIGLINYYTSNGGSPDRLFELLDVAKTNEPNNASLWYVEGNIRLKMDPPQVEKALEAYDKCAEIQPKYEYGYIGKGVYLYNHAVEIQEKASYEMDDAKFAKLVEEYESSLKACIVPFEKAYEVTADESIKSTIAEYIKNACFRFREDPEYKDKYEKYGAIVASGK
jgi:tetratricopeptide (TPR) repeat protein